MLSKYKTDCLVNAVDEFPNTVKVEIIPQDFIQFILRVFLVGVLLFSMHLFDKPYFDIFLFTIVIVLCFRSVASWFDEDGTLLFDILEKDVRELHNGIASEKKDK